MDAPLGDALEAQNLLVGVLVRKAWPQQSFLSVDAFCSYVSKRGFTLWSRDLGQMAQAGLLWPVVYVRAPVVHHAVIRREGERVVQYDPAPCDEDGAADTVERPAAFWFAGGTLQWIGEHAERLDPATMPDATEHDPVFAMPRDWCYYHPWQVLALSEIWPLIHGQLDAVALAKSDNPADDAEGLKQRACAAIGTLRSTAAQRIRETALLIAVEDLYLPATRGVLSAHGTQDLDHTAYRAWCQGVDRSAVVESLGFSVDDLRRLRTQHDWEGYGADPNRHILPAVRALAYSDRSKLEGAATLSWDHYEASDLLGCLLEDLTREPQPRLHGLVGEGPPPDCLEETGVHPRAAWQSVGARTFGLDTRPRVHWFVEGQTEAAFIAAYCDEVGICLDNESVRVSQINGVNRARDPNLLKAIEHAKSDGAAVFFTIDHDAGFDEVERLARAQGMREEAMAPGDLGPNVLLCGVLVWPTTFEDANFAREELLEAWLTRADVATTLASDDVRHEFAEYVAEQADATPSQCVRRLEKLHSMREKKPEVGDALGRLLAMKRVQTPGDPLRTMELLLLGVRQLAAVLRRGEVTYSATEYASARWRS